MYLIYRYECSCTRLNALMALDATLASADKIRRGDIKLMIFLYSNALKSAAARVSRARAGR